MKRIAVFVIAGLLGVALSGAALAQSAGGASAADPITLPGADPNSVVVPGTLEKPLPPPDGDVRTPQQRRRDARAFDRCVSRVQNRMEESSGSANPVQDNPEDYCARRLGMKDRSDIPSSRTR